MDQFLSSEGRQAVGETKLFPTLYVGEHRHGLFAVPSLVDEQTMMIRWVDHPSITCKACIICCAQVSVSLSSTSFM